jgi:hypothetical protein
VPFPASAWHLYDDDAPLRFDRVVLMWFGGFGVRRLLDDED